MKKYIAVTIAVLVVVGGLLAGLGGGAHNVSDIFGRPLALSFPEISLAIPEFPGLSLERPVVAKEAWQVFEAYLVAAHRHDLVALKNLSYQLSPTCSTPSSLAECFALMDGLYSVMSDLKESDFTQYYFDERQAILVSEKAPMGMALIFTLNSGTPKMLGIQWCLPNKDGKVNDCINTDRATRDKDKNSWWDDVETHFRK